MKSDGAEWKNGIVIFLFIGTYFLVIEMLDLAHLQALRLVNVFFVSYGVNLTIKHKMLGGQLNYVANLFAGFKTALIGVSLSIAAFMGYIELFMGEDYLGQLANTIVVTSANVPLWKYALGLFMEAISSSVIVSFAIMQRWKNVSSVSAANQTFFQTE